MSAETHGGRGIRSIQTAVVLVADKLACGSYSFLLALLVTPVGGPPNGFCYFLLSGCM